MRWTLRKFNAERRKMNGLAVSLTRMTAMVIILTLIPVPVKVSAVEEWEVIEQEVESESKTAPKETESLRETETETSEKEKPESEAESAPTETKRSEEAKKETESESKEEPRETESLKETEPETSEKEKQESESQTEPAKTEDSEETKKESESESEAIPKETESQSSDTTHRETESVKEKEQELSTKKEPAQASDDVSKEQESLKETETDNKEKEETVPKKTADERNKNVRRKELQSVEIMVPIYNYDVANIVVPARYAVALNPYELAVKTGDDEISTEQVVSRKYGILNKSSTDKIVRITLKVEDLNEGKIVFVDSPEEAMEADKDTYAVYLAAVPADDSGVLIGGENADCDTTAAELSDVEMNGSMDNALTLKEGENTLSFMLSKAVYDFEEGSELILDEDESEWMLDEDDRMSGLNEKNSRRKGDLKLLSLAPGEGGITAFTFAGVMNPKADWGKLLSGLRISAVYTYETATGEEEIVEGTGAMIES